MEWSDINEYIIKFWEFRLFIVDGNAITLGKVVVAFFLLVLGYFLSKKFSKQLEARVLSRLDIDPALRYTLHQFSFYGMLIIFTLFILNFLNIPVTVFTVLGGALAIGVGFGSQNIVNNFFSGVIIMIERPVRIGDMIEIGALKGIVEEIGIRSTRVKSQDNTHIVVPNSVFLEQNVLNWTLSDNVVRGHLNIGVAYGSDVQKVRSLLIEAAHRHSKVLDYPKSEVFFLDFGDNALVFQLYYYSHIKNSLE
ncbi:MAG: mechanosensitive ion channel, partial [Bdellovibrionales bacterium]|nr:mechanosensitive ion channel [Bdellovibrionales bacterium]